jgi:prepilin-type processing-associated H-X9-DG protein
MYFGWALMPIHYLATGVTDVNSNEGVAALDVDFLADMVALFSEPWSPSDYDQDVMLTSGKTVYRVREGIERFFITDINNPAASAEAQSDITAMYDQVGTEVANYNHVPGGGNVLFMDGHVEFIKYPGEFPVCKTWAAFFELASGL